MVAVVGHAISVGIWDIDQARKVEAVIKYQRARDEIIWVILSGIALLENLWCGRRHRRGREREKDR